MYCSASILVAGAAKQEAKLRQRTGLTHTQKQTICTGQRVRRWMDDSGSVCAQEGAELGPRERGKKRRGESTQEGTQQASIGCSQAQ